MEKKKKKKTRGESRDFWEMLFLFTSQQGWWSVAQTEERENPKNKPAQKRNAKNEKEICDFFLSLLIGF